MKTILKWIWSYLVIFWKWFVKYRHTGFSICYKEKKQEWGTISKKCMETRFYWCQGYDGYRIELGIVFDNNGGPPLLGINFIIFHIEFEWFNQEEIDVSEEFDFQEYKQRFGNECLGEECNAAIRIDGYISEYCIHCPNRKAHKVVESSDGKGPDTIIHE